MLWEDPEPEVPAFLEVAADNTSSVLETMTLRGSAERRSECSGMYMAPT